ETAFNTPPVPGEVLILSPDGVINTSTPLYSWTEVEHAAQYQLKISGSSGSIHKAWYSSDAAGCDDDSICEITPPGLILAEGTYTWNVMAQNPSGIGPWSQEKTFTFHDQIPLNAPTELAATAVSPDQIDLSWTDNSDDETAFHIERSLNGVSGWIEIDTVSGDSTSYQDTTLSCGTTYYYRVRAYRSGDTIFSEYSDTASATTDACPLDAPSELAANAVSPDQIDLSWTDNSDDETAFHIERSPDGISGWAEIATSAADATSYQNTTLSCGTTYYYRVRAYRVSDNTYSGYSNTANATINPESCVVNAPAIISVDSPWESGFVYLVSNTTVNEGVTLTIQAGAIVKFVNSSSVLIVHGTLDVQGTAESPVYFTSYKDDSVGGDSNGDGDASSHAPGDWRNIYITDTGSATFDHAIISYGGYSNSGGMLYISDNGQATLNNSAIRYSKVDGIQMRGGTTSTGYLTVSACTISDNLSDGIWASTIGYDVVISVLDSFIQRNGDYGIIASQATMELGRTDMSENGNMAADFNFISGDTFSNLGGNVGSPGDYIAITGTFTQDTNLPADPTIHYRIYRLTIQNGATLTIQAGVVIKFVFNSSWLHIYGTLNVQGTVAEPVYFTSYKDDDVGGDSNGDGVASSAAPGDWRNIYIADTGSATFDHASISYGGWSTSYGMLYMSNNGQATLNNT
ncbi:MAG: fibronectin type III domain-containing protein, partial [Anaerolineaceae bacterium]|nr:fibronectin type III domain-containing protein [Anaerolineaceae bacterium]